MWGPKGIGHVAWVKIKKGNAIRPILVFGIWNVRDGYAPIPNAFVEYVEQGVLMKGRKGIGVAAVMNVLSRNVLIILMTVEKNFKKADGS